MMSIFLIQDLIYKNMKLKERRYNLIFSRLRDFILDSEWDIGVDIPYHKLSKNLGNEFKEEELTYGLRHLVGKGYLEKVEMGDTYRLTRDGYEKWLFPDGLENPKKVFISHASEDRKNAVELKVVLENLGFTAFVV